MAVMASWNGKTWGVSSQRIAAYQCVPTPMGTAQRGAKLNRRISTPVRSASLRTTLLCK